jgi:DNA-binding NtrC family response regulator
MDGRFSVILCEHTTQAFTVLSDTRVDCVVADYRLDWRSGYRDGVHLLDQVASSYPHVGRVVFTGNKEALPPEAFTRHAVVEKNGQLWELAEAIVNEIERRSSVAPQNPG